MNDVTNIDYLLILSKKTFKISSCERKNVFLFGIVLDLNYRCLATKVGGVRDNANKKLLFCLALCST
jgi:hypothetical protein